ncbi:MAG: hypothetical protein J6Q65_06985, partial [Lentisphaeria bacterium]|nr:hypothetical protein [Lentisphaeria bacterium]
YKNVQTGRPTDMPTAKVGDKILYRRKTSVDTGDRLPVTGFTLTAIEGDAKTGKVTLTSDADPKTVFVAQRDKRIVSDYKTIALRNKLNNAEISTKVGAKVVLGTENTGLEEYTVTDLQGAGEGTVVILKNAAGKEFKITMPIDEEPAADQADATEGNAAKAE